MEECAWTLCCHASLPRMPVFCTIKYTVALKLFPGIRGTERMLFRACLGDGADPGGRARAKGTESRTRD